MECDHGQGSVGAGLVVGVAGCCSGDVFEELVAVGSFGGDGDGFEGFGAGFDLDHWVGEQVVVPGGVVGCAEVGGGDQQLVAVADVAERDGVRALGLGAGGGEQE